MTLVERGDAYLVLPGGTGTLVELALAWEMMNKSSLSGTVGGRRPLLVWEPYWRAVIECLNQEVHLGAAASPSIERFSRAMEIVTLVQDADHAAQTLKESLKRPL
jgi:predicted Rossmann-fold nucleotide-binding protein